MCENGVCVCVCARFRTSSIMNDGMIASFFATAIEGGRGWGGVGGGREINDHDVRPGEIFGKCRCAHF